MDISTIEIVWRRSRLLGMYTASFIFLLGFSVYLSEVLSGQAQISALNETNNWAWYSTKRNRQIIYEQKLEELLISSKNLLGEEYPHYSDTSENQINIDDSGQRASLNIYPLEIEEDIDYKKYTRSIIYSNQISNDKLKKEDIIYNIRHQQFLINIAQSQPNDLIGERSYTSTCELGDGLDQIAQCALNNRKIQDIVNDLKPILTVSQVLLVLAILSFVLSINDKKIESRINAENRHRNTTRSYLNINFAARCFGFACALSALLAILHALNFGAEPLFGKHPLFVGKISEARYVFPKNCTRLKGRFGEACWCGHDEAGQCLNTQGDIKIASTWKRRAEQAKSKN